MRINRTFRRLASLALTIVLCVSCLALSGSAAGENREEEFNHLLAQACAAEGQATQKTLIDQLWEQFGYEEEFANTILLYFGEPEGGFKFLRVRANGKMVGFTDARPYIDENNRTMIPLRAAVEALGAEVTWNQATQTASVTKNGITVNVTIGSKRIEIVQDGKTSYETMDTVAVLNAQEGRTYVPIRYVAEALGAYVDYADAFRVVGIYSDVLTAEEIEELRAYPYTLPRDAITYETYKSRNSQESLEMHYGTYRHTFGNFANAHEYLYYNMRTPIKFSFNDLGKTVQAATKGEFYALVAAEAAAEIGYSSANLTITFRADQSCVYQPDAMNNIFVTVRGIITISAPNGWREWNAYDRTALWHIDIPTDWPEAGESISFPVDIHMNLLAGYNVHINTCETLGDGQ